ncbi:MAG: hypothetical protein EBV06_11090 [Planctomycetia bacterium]|nr:hypothetical protein [Planctomycetia bacterium]
MAAPVFLIKCVARAAVKHVANFLTFGLAGEILIDAWDEYHRQTDESKRRQEIQALAALGPQQAREAARLALAELPLSNTDRQRIEDCLANAPAVVRRSLRSPHDPSGRTMQPGRPLRTADDLRAVMPLGPSRFRAGTTFGDYVLEELLGVGGFAEVWKARNPHMPNEPPVALKFITEPQAQERLAKHEAKVLTEIQKHSPVDGVVRLIRTHLHHHPPCLEFEYVDGCDLSALIRDRGETPWRQAAEQMRELCTIVGRVHRLPGGVVHRDIKPGNVLVRANGSFALADFGIGGLAVNEVTTKTRLGTLGTAGAVAGAYSANYASPQQITGMSADVRDDVYSLGVVWYQLLVGNLLMPAPTGAAWRGKLEAKGMPLALINLLGSMMEHERDDRPKDAAVVAKQIEEILTPPKPAPPPKPTPVPRLDTARIDRRAVLAGVALGGVALAAGTILLRSHPKPPESNWPSGLPAPVTNSIGMKFARIPAGKFMMGATKELNPNAYGAESPRHEVTLTKAFYLGIYEVTQEQWEQVMKNNPSYFKGSRRPVENVSWHEAMEFCKRLSELPAEKEKGHLYRLPTEAEWEYACRGGASQFSIYHFGNTITKENANFNSDVGETTEVGKYAPNAFGLYDMHGNVWEWCLDGQRMYQDRAETDPRGPAEGANRVIRGGSWLNMSSYCTASYRNTLVPDLRYCYVGFRLFRVSVGE